MKKWIVLFGITCTLLCPALLVAGEKHFAGRFHCGTMIRYLPANNAAFLQPEVSRSKPLPSENQLSAVELDAIRAGGLEYLFNRMTPSERMFGRIILWDETGNRKLSESPISIPMTMPARTMQKVEINAVYDACEFSVLE